MSMITTLLINNKTVCASTCSAVSNGTNKCKCDCDWGKTKCVAKKDQLLPKDIFKCYLDECDNVAHATCYLNMVEAEKQGVLLQDNTLDGSIIHPIVCGKQCYQKLKNAQIEI